MKKKGDELGFAEDGAPIRRKFVRADPIDLTGFLASILSRQSAAEEAARLAARRAEQRQRAAERARAIRFDAWIAARTRLRAVVIEIEVVLAPLGLYLGMADEPVHPVDLAAIEIRLFVHGRPCEGSLDITVNEAGHQFAFDTGGDGPVRRAALPDIARTTSDDYRATVLTYLERALHQGTSDAACKTCGRSLATVEDHI